MFGFGLTLLVKVRSNVPRPGKAKHVQEEKFEEHENVELEKVGVKEIHLTSTWVDRKLLTLGNRQLADLRATWLGFMQNVDQCNLANQSTSGFSSSTTDTSKLVTYSKISGFVDSEGLKRNRLREYALD